MINNNGMQTNVWGPPAWVFLYCTAKGYPYEIDLSVPDHRKRKKYMKRLFKSLGHTLPCSLCRDSYRQFLKEKDTKIKCHLNTRNDLIRCIYRLHNKINHKLCVPKISIPTFEEVDEFYEQFRAGCNKNTKDKFGCRDPDLSRHSVKSKVIFTLRKQNNEKDVKPFINHLGNATNDQFNKECVHHIFNDKDPKRRQEYYDKLNPEYKNFLQTHLHENGIQIVHTPNKELYLKINPDLESPD